MAKRIERVGSAPRSRSVRRVDDDGIFMGSSPLIDGVPDEYFAGRHISEFVSDRSDKRDSAFLMERDLQELKSTIIESCSSLAEDLVLNKLGRIFRVDL